MHNNSIEAYRTVDRVTARNNVLRAIKAHDSNIPVTRQLLAAKLGWEINRVTPRVCELINLGKIKENGSITVVTNGTSRKRSVLVVVD